MEYRKSYRGFVLWLAGYMLAMFAPLLLQTEDAGLLTRLSLDLTAVGVAVLAWIIWRTESVYWINGTTFEQAREAGSERRREFAAAHLRTFGRFAAGYLMFSALMQAQGIHYAVDIVAFTVGLIAAAFYTTRFKL